MNTKLIKSEIEKLARIAASWNDSQDIDAIERDLALDKVKRLYELLRFGAEAEMQSSVESVAATVAATIANTTANSDEKDVEVEFLFAEDDQAQIEDKSRTSIEISEQGDDKDVEVEFLFAEDEEAEDEASSTETTSNLPTQEAINEEDTIEEYPELKQQETLESIAQEEDYTENETPTEYPATQTAPSSGNLFGIEEVRKPRTSKHQRMMSIYSDNATVKSHEKQVDISKIFDFGVDSDSSMPKGPQPIESSANTTSIADSIDRSITLGDVMAQNSQTLADTISAPAPLAEEITNSKITSLTQGLGLNDKFLMIRDLFDGDDEAYDQAIKDLDSMESFDDCIIYIAENFEWNPDSEGAKFIMQLLERKYA